jgi:hypothetical protein
VPDWTAARAAIAGLHAEGTTPIGAGLAAAWAELSAEAGRPRAIVLLSDGFNNTAPDAAAVLPTIPADVPIFAIALGPAALTSALQTIAGSRPNGGYFAIASDQDVFRLHEIYATVQALASGMAVLSLSSADTSADGIAVTVPVEEGLTEVSFCASWDGAQAGVAVKVEDPAGAVRGVSSAATQVLARPTHHVVRVAAPEPGDWTVRVGAKRKATRVTVSAAAPSELRLTAAVRRARGGGVAVSAVLQNAAKPVDDAKVIARITVPGLSVADAQRKFADQIAKVKLPKELLEPKLSAHQRGLVAFAAFAAGARDQSELLGRTTIELELQPVGEGRYTAVTELPAVGGVDVAVIARGRTPAGHDWERRAQVDGLIGVK